MASESWPRQGYPVVPERYRLAWYVEALPDSVVQHAGLDAGTRIGDLDAGIWERGLRAERATVLANHIVALVTARLYHLRDSELAHSPVLIHGRVEEDSMDYLPFANRTRNVLETAVAGHGVEWLNSATAADFLSLRGAGAKTLLDFATIVERDSSANSTSSAATGVEFEGVSTEWQQVAAEFPVEQISPNDPRLRSAELLGASLDEAIRRQIDEARRFGSVETSQEIRRRIAELNEDLGRIRDQPLDEALREFTELAIGERADAVSARLGWDGQGGMTLREAGKLAGVTHERIRQLEKKVRDTAQDASFLPVLDRAIKVLDDAAERFATDVDGLLQSSGITTERFLPHGVATAARIFGRTHRFVIGDDKRSVELDGDVVTNPLRQALRGLSDVNHVAPVAELAARVAETTGEEPDEEVVRAFLDRSSVVWLDSSHTWFWDGTARLRYRNYARKVLAVSPEVTLETLREGVLRHHRTRNISLPRSAFEGLCRAIGFEVDGGMVRSLERIEPEDVLGENELTILKVLRANDNVMRVWDLRDECVSRGVNRNSFWVYLTYAPFLERLAPSVYALRGSDVDPAAVSVLAQATDSSVPSLQDHGWTRDGAVWLGYRVNRSLLDTGVVSVPRAIRDVLGECRLELYSIDGTSVGEFVVGAGGQGWGLSPFMARRGVERDDYIVLALDSQLEIASVQVGTKDLIFTYQEGDGWGPRHFLDEATAPDPNEME